ncbi:nucleotidyltransferase domain-containing protein [Lentibacillus sp. CBA3610]|uniref:nucleotidyltransferase domain-containing protein n=1 Tax=Lentibacillus sp. CBA3610 TaxID=2518176 RepID=UPI001595C40C|nr:nucleotidyltransferase domain-containing protein [Lentibacillus sp. CBA3610]
MNQIKEMGYLCHIDDNGYITNESDLKNVGTEFRRALHSIQDYLLSFLPKEIHSIYIRGSVPRGLGIEGVSDIDVLVITHFKPENLTLDWVEKAEKEINKENSSLNGVELGFYHLNEVMESKYFFIISFMLKTHSICIYGKDLRPSLPNYKAGHALANDHIIKIRSQIDSAKSDLEGNEDVEDIKDCCIWIMKLIVRCGLALVIIDEGTYTRDLYPAYKLFSRHYPQKKKEMRQALEFAINPSLNPRELLPFLDTFGGWMVRKADDWLNVHNPTEIKNLPVV